MQKLTETEIQASFAKLQGWQLVNGQNALQKHYQFADFVAAFGFMSQVALIAEKLDHHPDWSNTYGTVDITLTTHSAKGLTDLDFKFASLLDKLA